MNHNSQSHEDKKTQIFLTLTPSGEQEIIDYCAFGHKSLILYWFNALRTVLLRHDQIKLSHKQQYCVQIH